MTRNRARIVRWDGQVKPGPRSGPGLLLAMAEAALEAVHPDRLVPLVLGSSPGNVLRVRIGERTVLFAYARLFVVALGKAAGTMAHAAHQCLCGPSRGFGVAPEGQVWRLPGWQWYQSDHPLPTWRSIHAARRLRAFLAEASHGDVVVLLLSGGASSLLCLPRAGVSLDDLRTRTRLMLEGGADIFQLNRMRRELDLTKAGGLARWACPALTVSLVLSDVPSDPLWAIGSGPTVPHAPGEQPARWPFPPPFHVLLGSNTTALRAAASMASPHVPVETRPHSLQGPVPQAAQEVAHEALRRHRAGERFCLLMGGETTVTVKGQGIGGRNLELALHLAIHFAGTQGLWALTLATDGKDGSSPAAGALVDGDTAREISRAGLNPALALAANDSYTALKAAKRTLHTGPTGTNVCDILMVLSDPSTP